MALSPEPLVSSHQGPSVCCCFSSLPSVCPSVCQSVSPSPPLSSGNPLVSPPPPPPFQAHYSSSLSSSSLQYISPYLPSFVLGAVWLHLRSACCTPLPVLSSRLHPSLYFLSGLISSPLLSLLLSSPLHCDYLNLTFCSGCRGAFKSLPGSGGR